jgi:hypothetical protein
MTGVRSARVLEFVLDFLLCLIRFVSQMNEPDVNFIIAGPMVVSRRWSKCHGPHISVAQ